MASSAYTFAALTLEVAEVQHQCEAQQDPDWKAKAEAAYGRAFRACEALEKTGADASSVYDQALDTMTEVSHVLLNALHFP